MQTAKFKDDLIVKSVDATKWQIVTPFFFYFDENNKEEGVTVPEGFITDFASIPRIFWSILAPTGLYTKAAVVHDFLYSKENKSDFERKFCDRMFLEGMRALNVGRITRYTMYLGVRCFGFFRFKKSF